MDIRTRIMETIEAKGKSVRGTSIAAGLGETTLRNYLKGMTNSLTVDSVEKIAAELGVTPKWLLFGEEDKPQAEIINIWDGIPIEKRDHAKDVLRTFVQKQG